MPKTIDTETLKAKIDRGDTFVLIDTLLPREYEKWHLPGAINIHFNKIGGQAKKRFSPDDEIVVYCHDEACRASIIAAEKLEKLGFHRVWEYSAGKNGWRDAGYPIEEGAPDGE